MTYDVDIHDGIAAYLEGLRRDECYRVDRVLKESPVEKTCLVYFTGANGAEQGPLVRKEIAGGSGLGSVYWDLYEQRRLGRRFKYLPAVYDCYEMGDRLVVVMEYARGRTLREVVAMTSPHNRPDLVRRLFPVLCDAVDELHGVLPVPVVHRDLTPSNVVCSETDPTILTLIDFGIARTYKSDADGDTTHFGTRPYAPPEQFGFGQTDVRTDVYALGLVLFFCLTGRDAVSADRLAGYASPDVPEPLRAVVAKAASLDPADRFGTARDLRAAFVQAVETPASAYGGADDGVVGRTRSGVARKAQTTVAENLVDTLSLGSLSGLGGGGLSPAVSGNAPGGLPVAAFGNAPGTAYLEPVGRSRTTRLLDAAGKVWNGILLTVFALYLALCVGTFVNPSEALREMPWWYVAYGSFIYLPVLGFSFFWTLYDKRRFSARHPKYSMHWGWWILAMAGLLFLNQVVYVIVHNAVQ